MRPLLLDLFCGAGGAAMGYHCAGFDVVGVDLNPGQLRHYPFPCVRGDALNPPIDVSQFDAIHASPPCQAYVSSRFFNAALGRESRHPKLVEPTRELLDSIGLPYVIENVPQAPMLRPITLCGSMFGLRVRRHRRFESNRLLVQPKCRHAGHDFVGVYGGSPGGRGWNDDGANDGYSRKERARSLADARDAMGVTWADWHGVKEAIPPAYTEFIGRQLLEQIGRAAA